MNRRVVALIGIGAVTAASAQTIEDQRRSLDRAQIARASALARAADLERARATAIDDAGRLRAMAGAIAARIQAAEADAELAEAQIGFIERLRAAQRARLAAKQAPTARLVAALATLARRPAVLALLQPGSIGDLVHVHAVLTAVIPVVQSRTADLRAEVERGRALRSAADGALIGRRRALATLNGERQQLAHLEAGRRAAATNFAGSAMVEQDRAMAIGEDARDITDLIGQIASAATVRAQLESLPGPRLRPTPGQVALPGVTTVVPLRIPAYRLPVMGRVVTGLGEVSATGVRARGLTLLTRDSAQVVAPTSGRIAYAAAFRGYGQIVVVDHGRGWTTLITGLAALDVKVGDQVDQGSPLGRAGTERPMVTIELRRQGVPVDIAKLAT